MYLSSVFYTPEDGCMVGRNMWEFTVREQLILIYYCLPLLVPLLYIFNPFLLTSIFPLFRPHSYVFLNCTLKEIYQTLS